MRARACVCALGVNVGEVFEEEKGRVWKGEEWRGGLELGIMGGEVKEGEQEGRVGGWKGV